MKKKIIWFLMSMTISISLLFSACNGDVQPSDTASSEVSSEVESQTSLPEFEPLVGTLVVATQQMYYGGSSPETGVLYDYFKTYHPDLVLIEQNLASASSAVNHLTIAAVTGELPDVFHTITNEVDRLIKMEAIYPLNEFMEQDTWYESSVWSAGLDLMKRGDKYYGVSTFIMPRAIVINEEIFDKMGVEYPDDDWTIDEFMDIAVRLTDKSAGISGIDIRPWNEAPIHMFLQSYGVQGFKEVEGQKVSNLAEDANAVVALEKLMDLTVTKKVGFTMQEYQDLGEAWNTVWENGRVAMTIGAPWALPIDPEFDELFFRTRVVRLPQGPTGIRAGFPQNHGFAIHPASEKKELAWKFLKLLTSEHFFENAKVKNLVNPEFPPRSYMFSEDTTHWGPGLPGINVEFKTHPDIQGLLDGFVVALDDMVLVEYGGLGVEYINHLGNRFRNVYDGNMDLMEGLRNFDQFATESLFK